MVLSYNFSRFLPQCIESILGQEGAEDFELIVVDDASTDDTRLKLEACRDERIRLILHEVNRGHVASVNEAMAEARGDFIARIDGDDRHRPHFLKSTLSVFDRFPEVGLVYGDVAMIDAEGEVAQAGCDRVHGGRDHKGNEFVQLLEKNFICAPTVIARREAWRAALPVPEGLAFHDWYFTLMMARRYPFYYVNDVLAEYRVHGANLHSRISREKSEERSILWLLDRIYAEREETELLDRAKRRAKARVYAAHFVDFATKYFGFGMYEDARRCYLRALQHRPALAFRADVIRRLAATLIGRTRYEAVKGAIHALQGKRS